MADIRQPTTNYVHPTDPNLLNIHKAMEYRDSQPHLRVTLGSDTITITGDVNLLDTVSLTSSTLAALETLTVNQGTSPWITNTTVTNWPALQYVNGVLYAVQSGTWSVGVTGNVTVDNFTSTVNIASLPAVSGTVSVSSLPSITGTVAVSNFTSTVFASNFTSTVNVSSIPSITGTVVVSNFTSTVFASNFTSTVSISGTPTVNIGTMPEVEIKNDTGNPIPVSKNTTANSNINPIYVNANLVGSGVSSGVISSIDSKGRLKVQTQESIFFNTFQYGKETDVWDESTVNGASATFDATQCLVNMSVTSTVGSKVVRQTRDVMRYTAGRQNTLTFSVRLEMPVVGVRRRFGLFNDLDGCYFEDSGTLDANGQPEYAVVLISTASGSLTTERIARNNWNGDKLDGAGPSGITANPLAQQMICIDYEWYGAGQIVFCFIINGLPRVIHTFSTGNRLLLPWSRTPFLPIRLEIENFGGAAGTHHLYQGSNSVLVEGRLVKQGIPSNILTPLTGITLPDANVFYPVISVRMKPANLEAVVLITHFVANTLDNTDIYYKVITNATINGTWVDNPDVNAFTQYNHTSTGDVTDGHQVDSGFITAGSAVRIELSKDADLQLGRGSMGTVSDIITVAIAAKNANKKAVASLSWIEQR